MPCSDFRTGRAFRKSNPEIFLTYKSSVSTDLVLKAEQLSIYVTYYQKYSQLTTKIFLT
jgi:hypothetical protein